MGNLISYLLALWQNWTWFVTGAPFLIDRLLRQSWLGYDARVAKYLSAATRTRVTVLLMVLGFLVANYLAFSSEHDRAERFAGSKPIHRHLSAGEIAGIKTHFAGATGLVPLIQICSVSAPEAERYAQDFWDALHDANMTPLMHSDCIPLNDTDRGLFVGVRDQDHPSAAATEFMKRLLAAGFQIKETRLKERDATVPADFDLFIAEPEEAK